MVSLLGSIGSIVLVWKFIRRETRSWPLALAGAALLAASNPQLETAMDFGRVDALFTFCLLSGAYVARSASLASGRKALQLAAASGALMGLALAAKSPLAALPVAIGLAIFFAVVERRALLPYVIGFVGVAGVILLALMLQSGRWPTFYLWDLPRQHAFGREVLFRFWFQDILPHFAIPLLIGPLFVIGSWNRGNRKAAWFFGLLLFTTMGTGWAARSNGGGAENVLMPAIGTLSILFGLGLDEAIRQFSSAGGRANGFRTYFLLLGALQFVLLVFNPRSVLPVGADAQADARLAAALGALPGPVFAPDFTGYLAPDQQGQQPLFGAAQEIQGGYGGSMTPEGQRWNAALKQALENRQFTYVILQRVECCYEDVLRSAGYVYQGSPFSDSDPFYSWRTPRTPDPKLYVPGTS